MAISRARCVFLATVVVGSSACSLLVSTGGLSDGDASAPGIDGGSDATPPSEEAGSDGSSDGGGFEATGTDSAGASDSRSSPDSGRDSAPDTSTGPADSGDERDSAPCTPITIGLVGHYTMGAGSISGSTLADVSGGGHNAALVGFTQAEPQSAPAPFGQALVFSSADQAYVEVSVLPLDTAPGGMNSVSMWFYRSGPVGNVNDVLVSLPNTPVYDLWLTYGVGSPGTNVYLCFNVGNSDCYGIASTSLLDRWVHVVAVFPNGATTGGTLYVDGQRQTSACLTNDGFSTCSGQTGTAAAPLNLGMGNNGFFYYGVLYDVRVYNRALTASEAAALHGGTACP